MTTCSVLHCQETGTETLNSSKSATFEALVCSSHKAAADAGAPWLPNRDITKGILMGSDVPPGLGKWTIHETEAPGVVLTIETDRAGEQPFELYLTNESFEYLGQAFTKP